ncbi:MAG: hypothetical protein JO081_03755, partial [Alphaproteobacteria bacterium]|nr:hypothetical protein [Alphaproteobacteria bacterium]
AISTMALGINNEGQIVGAFVDSTGEHGFLDTDGSFTTIDPPGSLLFEFEANGINDMGRSSVSTTGQALASWPRRSRRYPNRQVSRCSASG